MTFETEQLPCLVCKKPPLTVEVDKAGNLYIACPKCSLRMTVTDAQKQRAERAARVQSGPPIHDFNEARIV